MPQLIEVAFKGNRKEFFLWEGETAPPVRSAVVVDADRGEDIGHVHATGGLAEKRAKGTSHGPHEAPVELYARRIASDDELLRLKELREDDESVRRKAMERVRANNLQMKLSDAEWRWDRRKLTIFFTAEKRVDFRNLVRELASLFRTRIELKQIGVRDEAKRLGGIGRCGREYCSASWLPDLRPVNLGVAKDQRLSLNPSQISGACGRLMCCLRYEHEFYVQQRRRFPKEGKVVTTSVGEEKVVANDIFRERVTLRNAEGETRIVALGDLRREMQEGPAEPMTFDDETPPIAVEGLTDEVIRLQDTSELPAWLPRASLPTRRLVVVEAEPEPDVTEEEDDGAEDDEEDGPPEGGADESATESSDEGSDPANPRLRGRRRRGRRGGRGGRRGPQGRGQDPGGDGGGLPPGDAPPTGGQS
ncbi:MAG: regulatory iron-sulfur-containing complex subunit RicT [Gemmatimonadaceae bacterium]